MKKIFALVLTLVTALSLLSGCGDSGSKPPADTDP